MTYRTRSQLVAMADASFRRWRINLIVLMHSWGFSDQEMADVLDVSTRTVANHRRAAGLAVNRSKPQRSTGNEPEPPPNVSLRSPIRGAFRLRPQPGRTQNPPQKGENE